MKTRPGMPVVCRLPDGRYLMIYERVGLPDVPAYFRYSDDGRHWGDPQDPGTLITDAEGNFMSGTPYVIWTPLGGKKGSHIASAKSMRRNGEMVGNGLMVNCNLGKGHWTFMPTDITYQARPHSGGYSNALLIVEN